VRQRAHLSGQVVLEKLLPGCGGALVVAGILGVALAAPHVGVNGSPWTIVPGLAVAGAGLAVAGAGLVVLVIPLVNVVLAAVPVSVAGGASGLFSTAQQLGGALLGTVFFGYLNGHFFRARWSTPRRTRWARSRCARCCRCCCHARRCRSRR